MRDHRANPALETKIKQAKELKKIISGLKSRGKKIVFTNGCFDLLHYGHVKYLESARSKGDILVVAVNSDASVRRIKGRRRPIVSQKHRLKVVAALASVDYVVAFREDTPFKTIKLLQPDILIKGADWNKKDISGAGFVLSYAGSVRTIPLVKGSSTTNLIKKIAQAG
ncbi:MAG: D-glycero-beta-D-manno-heptose 1-phosphate adenylyltransferase [Candidatus Omnitrophica bacterium]|nr:D-glycero-beta-D-manno-heptose 1-phosphate adenylyltransferase [Candidatus Omnitrophota bacterium]MBU4345805.1 D-glycero-beta-D-manno-heptose 1-phosphate adenylyltransferase [Candidatus Omnitrophota bacterium]MBU4473436.1 D-glycero-beta-D-manno-heptose 1-phosphate adenylyltransferase [Candidatus Omnitrophota bacterium]MCG2706229.1 D-glycero-beta-D-manno-heptose 1-phosphate adenylyltransferase [Candidatus Omnitrophota bacterium]